MSELIWIFEGILTIFEEKQQSKFILLFQSQNTNYFTPKWWQYILKSANFVSIGRLQLSSCKSLIDIQPWVVRGHFLVKISVLGISPLTMTTPESTISEKCKHLSMAKAFMVRQITLFRKHCFWVRSVLDVLDCIMVGAALPCRPPRSTWPKTVEVTYPKWNAYKLCTSYVSCNERGTYGLKRSCRTYTWISTKIIATRMNRILMIKRQHRVDSTIFLRRFACSYLFRVRNIFRFARLVFRLAPSPLPFQCCAHVTRRLVCHVKVFFTSTLNREGGTKHVIGDGI